MTKRANDPMAAEKLRGILFLLENLKGKDMKKVLLDIRELAIEALQDISKPDQLFQRSLMLLSVIRDTTKVVTRKMPDGTLKHYPKILNPEVLGWALGEIELLMEKKGGDKK